MEYTIFNTAWGPFGFVSEGKRLIRTFLPQPRVDIRRAIRKNWPDAEENLGALPRFRRQVVDYFTGRRVQFKVDLELTSQPPFRAEVLKACNKIPYGKTASYADLARAAGNAGAARAVGSAMANNPLPLVVPCHRVLCSDGSLGGFSSPSGVKEKLRLLTMENADVIRSSALHSEANVVAAC